MIFHDAPQLTVNENAKEKEWKFNKFLNKSDVANQKLLLEYELWSMNKNYANKEIWGKPVSVVKDISLNIKVDQLDEDEAKASKFMSFRLLNGLLGYIKDLPVDGNEYLNQIFESNKITLPGAF